MQSEIRQQYLTENISFPFCKGCGHSHVLRKLSDALARLAVPPSDVVLVTDIGCIGLADMMFETVHTVHTTHGRSSAFATGIQIADAIAYRGKLKTIVLIGDGGAMIGLQHLINGALLNADITVLLANNFLFGMTGGQNSAFSPFDFITPTTPAGNIVPPLDICRTMIAAQSEFVARKIATDKDLTTVIAEAIAHQGFSLVEIVDLCTEHAMTKNDLAGNKLAAVVEEHGRQIGLLLDGKKRKPFGDLYSTKYPKREAVPGAEGAEVRYTHSLPQQIGIVIAGSAGERVQSSAKRLCDAAILSGLSCTQKNDNPVTQGSGFSLSEVIISPEEIYYTAIDQPDAAVIVSADGLNEIHEKGLSENFKTSTIVIADEELDLSGLRGVIYRRPFRKEFGKAKAASKGVEYFLEMSKVIPVEAFAAPPK